MFKSELRKKYTEKRKALSKDEVLRFSEQIADQFILYFKPPPHSKIHCFLTIEQKIEVETSFLIDYFFQNHIRVFVPKIVDKGLVSIELFPDSELAVNSWGIHEPVSNKDSEEKDFDFFVTPLLYCDHFGNRVGYGKGFYDGLFAGVTDKGKKIGVNFFPPNETVDDVLSLDIPLDYLVTPAEVLSFGSLTSNATK